MRINIKKTIKYTLLLILVSFIIRIILGIFGIIPPYENRVAKDPVMIADQVDFDLPDYEIISYEDNFDRSSSAWSQVIYNVKLKNPLSERDKKKLNKLVEKDSLWLYDSIDNSYHYKYYNTDINVANPEITIDVDVKQQTVTLIYSWWDWES